ncbi:Dinucleoside triphosphate hydrolase [Exophiala xenobiotica]|nr:Dinucleoside triphosphate hydrolase [Exophiala xenobiotica]KAK5281151.1 Dinucleoside triphosphate hydrolase [Exophiala xenobiotica]KAK5384271.1 Dinucleoside triphosphate hydrolase [Exophiala xenobiotica]KAK5399409.1 Dinucleoside triphosphate hydrolase [Exophiala xenobiotica]KAK5416504.1 Dinucleoside triphosphate hydrolase [Exophiala xenobiotica]
MTIDLNDQGNHTASQTETLHPAMPQLQIPTSLKFGPFSISSQVFHTSRTQLSYGLVNLKPVLPGHVLVCPVRVVPRISQLSVAETADLFNTVRVVSRTLERVYSASALNIAIQDGVDAGQSVPHVHVHIIPRQKGDYDHRGGGDQIYEAMDGVEGDVGKAFVEMQRLRDQRMNHRKEFSAGPDSDRKPRSEEEMKKEAEWLRSEMEKDREEDS